MMSIFLFMAWGRQEEIEIHRRTRGDRMQKDWGYHQVQTPCSKQGKKMTQQQRRIEGANCTRDSSQVTAYSEAENFTCSLRSTLTNHLFSNAQPQWHCLSFPSLPQYWDVNTVKTLFSQASFNENVMLWLTEFPLMLAISFNFLNTPPAVRLAGWNIMRWLLRELSATRPKSPFSCASALILSNCRPGNKN